MTVESSPAATVRVAPISTIVEDLPGELSQFTSRRRTRAYLPPIAICCDTLMIAAAFLIGNLIRFGDLLHAQGLNMIVVVVPIYFAIAVNDPKFGIQAVVKPQLGSRHAMLSFILALGAVWMVVFFLKVSTDFSRLVFAFGSGLGLLLLPLMRFSLAAVARRMFGASPICEVVIEDGMRLSQSPDALRLDAERHGLKPHLNDPAALDRLGRCLRDVDRVVVACPPNRRMLWAMALRGADVNGEVVAPELDELQALGLSQLDGYSTLVVAAGPLGVLDRSFKRILDLTLVIASLPITLPLMAAVAIAVRLDSPGPIIFSQERVGLGNRLFKVYKFRSMYVDRLDGAGNRSTGRNDERVTPVGRFIRATSMDELPQLFNVLEGAMSIVGPRPHALGSRADDQLFWDIDLSYWHRHAVKPGLTGLAQVRGYRGATENTADLTNRLQADLEYLSGWSIWRDLRIILATFRVMLHRNAF